MFSLQIVDTDAFLDMPQSSQLLYFHLCMRADDEGFVGNPKRIMRTIGASDDDYKILITKRFIIIFESSVMVIKHWLIHNTIRMDRFGETTYRDEKALLKIKENRAYTMDENAMATIWQPKDNQRLPQVKLSKVNIVKTSDLDLFIKYWNQNPIGTGSERNTTARKTLLPNCRKITEELENVWQKFIKSGHDINDAKIAVERYIKEIQNRDPNNDYARHRFSCFEFISQKNGLLKFANR